MVDERRPACPVALNKIAVQPAEIAVDLFDLLDRPRFPVDCCGLAVAEEPGCLLCLCTLRQLADKVVAQRRKMRGRAQRSCRPRCGSRSMTMTESLPGLLSFS